jgi:putative phage-type endonuclease
MTPEQRAAWLLERRRGLGSSDAAAVCGMRPFGRLPLDVYLDKLGVLPPVTSTPMRLGQLLEEAVAVLYAEDTGRIVTPPAQLITWHPEISWCFASIDRVTACGRVLECKTAGFRSSADGWGAAGTDQVPGAYLVQCQQQLACSGAAVADLAVLFRAYAELAVYEIPRNEELIGYLLEIEGGFWQHVEKRQPPPLDWSSPRTTELLKYLWRPVEGLAVNLPPECGPWADRYEYLGASIRQQTEERQICKGRILAAMREATQGHLPDGRTAHNGKQFRITSPKEKKTW